MAGALMLNIMFNMTRIAQKHNNDDIQPERQLKLSRIINGVLILSFPLIGGLLFLGDYASSKKKETFLINTAKSIVEDKNFDTSKLINYTFTKEWILHVEQVLKILSTKDKVFNNVSIILKDSIDDVPVFLTFDSYANIRESNKKGSYVKKIDYILETTQVERVYLDKVFGKDFKEIRFSAHDGHYELFFPYFEGGKKAVIYFSDRQRYGKIGS